MLGKWQKIRDSSSLNYLNLSFNWVRICLYVIRVFIPSGWEFPSYGRTSWRATPCNFYPGECTGRANSNVRDVKTSMWAIVENCYFGRLWVWRHWTLQMDCGNLKNLFWILNFGCQQWKSVRKGHGCLLSAPPINLSFSECTGTSGHTLGLSPNKSSWAGVLWFHLTRMMTILVVPMSRQELF